MLLIFYFKLFNLIILLIALIIPKDIEFKLQLHLVLKIEKKSSYVCEKNFF